MGRYFFHYRSSKIYVRDEEGSVHLRLDDALREAYESAREIMKSQISVGRLDLGEKIEIVGDTGILLATIAFGEAVSTSPSSSPSPPTERRGQRDTHGKNDRRRSRD